MGKGRLPGYVSSGTLREVETASFCFLEGPVLPRFPVYPTVIRRAHICVDMHRVRG